MKSDISHPGNFNNEDSNHTANPHIDQVLDARLSRRGLLRGAAGAAGVVTGRSARTGAAAGSASTLVGIGIAEKRSLSSMASFDTLLLFDAGLRHLQKAAVPSQSHLRIGRIVPDRQGRREGP